VARFDPAARCVTCTLIYVGPEGAGKTCSVLWVHGKVGSRATPLEEDGPSLGFEVEPEVVDELRGWTHRLRVATLRGNRSLAEWREQLAGADGVVFVGDSDPERIAANARARARLFDLLKERGLEDGGLPLVYQWNKRDLPSALSGEELERALNPGQRPVFYSVATRGGGVYSPFQHAWGLIRASLQAEQQRGGRFAEAEQLERTTVYDEVLPLPESADPSATQTSIPQDLGLSGTSLDFPELNRSGPEARQPEESTTASQAIRALELDDGRRLGPYHLVSELGRGSLGVIYRGWDESAGREVALKLILRRTADAPTVQRFRGEGEGALALRHPGLVRLLAMDHHEGWPYLAYELVEGCRDAGRVFQELDLKGRVDLVRQAAVALGHAHVRGQVHRDVKPSNVLVDPSGRVKVADFGLAQALGMRGYEETGSFVGALSHMAPERIEKKRGAVGPPADVWSLGVILYAALTDHLPFEGKGLDAQLAAVLYQDPTPPRDLAQDVPAGLEAVCLKALAKRQADRFHHGGAFADALERELADLGGDTEAGAGRLLATDDPSGVEVVGGRHEDLLEDLGLPDKPKLAVEVRHAAMKPENVRDPFIVLEVLPAGGAGTAWRVWDTRAKALSLVRTFGSGAFTGAAVAQLEVIAQLRSQHLVSLRRYGLVDEQPYVAWAWIKGRTLAEERRSAKRTVMVLRDVAGAVGMAARHRVIHGCLTPASVLISGSGRGRLADLGLAPVLAALQVDPAGDLQRYRPPERFANPWAGDERSDVYSLGAILYYGLTGQPPGSGEVAPPSYLCEESLPTRIDRICLRCLEEDPDLRYRSAIDVAEALADAISTRPPSDTEG
jgi:serine/threonine-protein kinase